MNIWRPCPGCYDGNDELSPEGWFRDRHADKPGFPTRNGLITNDGRDLSLNEIKTLCEAASARGNLCVAWDKARQGLEAGFLAPSRRDYQTPGLAEQLELISFLRGE